MRPRVGTDGPLWAITSYFNPMGFARRRTNYRVFRQRLRAPLVAVEHSYDGHFELGKSDAEILIQCVGGGVMWQKERLLNLAVQALPPSCRSVVWIDCDVVFTNSDWPALVDRALARVPLVQAFSNVHYLRPEARPPEVRPHDVTHSRPSAALRIAEGLPPEHCLGHYCGPRAGVRAAGLAWACRREVLQQHGLYDACIIGGGGLAVLAAAYGLPEVAVANHQMNERQADCYRAWARGFHTAVRGEVSFAPGEIWHLWHGDPDNRRINERHAGLARFAFDPARDIAIDPSGCWRWNSDKPDMHEYLQSYFASRQEDTLLRRERSPAPVVLPTAASTGSMVLS